MTGRPLPDRAADRAAEVGPALVAAVAATIATAVRLRLLAVPLERDEGEYAYAGRLLQEGVPPFESVYGMKLPGTHLAYGLAFALLGPGTTAVRLLLVAVNLASTALVFSLGRAWIGPAGAMGAAVAFAFLSLQTAMLGPFAHATHFVVLPALAGLLVQEHALRAPAGRRDAATIGSGLLLGAAVVAKQPGAVFLAFALARLVVARRADRGALLREGALLVAAAALPSVAVLAWAGARGHLGRYAGWLFRYGAGYAKPLPLSEGAVWLRVALVRILGQAPLLWGLAGVGALLSVSRRAVPRGRLLLALAVASFVGVCPGLTFREHYFLLALPAVALMAGAAVEAASRVLRDRGRVSTGTATLAAGAIALLAGVQSVVAQRELLLSSPPDAVARALYGDNPFPESPRIAAWIAERTSPDDRVAVFGSEPQILFLAGRRSATGHVYMYPLLEPQPDARAMQEEMMREVVAARPAFVVSVRVPTSWVRREDSDARILDEMAAFLRDGYEPCGAIVASADGESRYLWEADAARAGGSDDVLAVVLRRRDLGRAGPGAGGG